MDSPWHRWILSMSTQREATGQTRSAHWWSVSLSLWGGPWAYTVGTVKTQEHNLGCHLKQSNTLPALTCFHLEVESYTKLYLNLTLLMVFSFCLPHNSPKLAASTKTPETIKVPQSLHAIIFGPLIDCKLVKSLFDRSYISKLFPTKFLNTAFSHLLLITQESHSSVVLPM